MLAFDETYVDDCHGSSNVKFVIAMEVRIYASFMYIIAMEIRVRVPYLVCSVHSC